jgi:exonuclease SbcC
MLDGLQREGTQYGDSYRLNKVSVEELEANLATLEIQLSGLAGVDKEKLGHARSVAQLNERLESLRAQTKAWESTGRARLDATTRELQEEQYASQARASLARVDAELAELGYDAAEHDRVRERELSQRAVEQEYARLQAARAALAPLEDEIQNIRAQMDQRSPAIARQQEDLQESRAAIEAAEAGLPDAGEAERTLFALQEQENALNQQVGAARQRVAILDDLRVRRSELETSRQSLAVSIGHHKMLERAFGRDGVPALLIEQSLPELESRANEILDRLSDGRMSVHFVTQAGYRDKKRQDLRETLDIQISDGAGSREYEMYSGGEAFRVNFAIRMALSQVLAGRKGARLQTLIIDEGFGSQDEQGRQRLIETINLVRHDFAKILLITHLEELKDAFPTRIEVVKTERGSSLTVS